jgi:hypothetical protein
MLLALDLPCQMFVPCNLSAAEFTQTRIFKLGRAMVSAADDIQHAKQQPVVPHMAHVKSHCAAATQVLAVVLQPGVTSSQTGEMSGYVLLAASQPGGPMPAAGCTPGHCPALLAAPAQPAEYGLRVSCLLLTAAMQRIIRNWHCARRQRLATCSGDHLQCGN